MSNETAIASLKQKIDDLNQQAWEVRVTDLPKAFELSQESVKLGRSINYPKGLAEGLRSLGFSYVRYSKNEEATPLLKESLSLFQSLNDHKGQAIVYEYLGIIERNWGNLGTSLELLLKGNDLIQQTDPPEIEITSCYQIGVTYKHLGNHENALDYLYRTLSLAKKINFTLMEAYAIHIIGSIYFDNGNFNQALDCYQQGLIIRRQSHDKWGEAGSLDNIGFTYLKLNDLDKAIDYCKQSLAICQGTGDKKGEANALLHLAEIYEQADDVKQAAGFSNESLEIRKARGDKRGEAEVLLFLAGLYKNRNDVEDHKIFEWLSNALKIADEIKAQDLLSKAYYNLHEYYQQKGNFKESLIQLEAHFQIEKELHKNSINQKIANLEISHKAEAVSQRNKELTELNEKIEKANEELKIEAALERVRSRSMAMYQSDEVMDVAVTVYDELQKLDFKSGGTTIIIMDKESGFMEHWLAGFIQKNHVESYSVKNIHHPLHAAQLAAWRKGEKFVSIELSGTALKAYAEEMFTQTGYKNLPDEEKAMLSADKQAVFNLAYMSHGALMWAPSALSDEKAIILQRFAKVFEQTYTRFLDLQKAEAQAKEAQTEVALERIRARAMAMHSSNELMDVAHILREQMGLLDQPDLETSVVNLFDEDSDYIHSWHAFREPGSSSGRTINGTVSFRKDSSELTKEMMAHYNSGKKEYTLEATGKKLNEFIQVLVNSQPEISNYIGKNPPGKVYYHFATFTGGALLTVSYQPTTENIKSLQRRAASVFDMAYRRYLDLKKAEAQAREAQIEVALERIRSRTMAMHKSEELAETAQLLYNEFGKLGINTFTCGYMFIDEAKNTQTAWVVLPDGTLLPNFIVFPLTGDHVLDSRYKEWKVKKPLHVFEIQGEVNKEHHRFLSKHVPAFVVEDIFSKMPDRIIFHCANFSYGYLLILATDFLSEEDLKTIIRFAKVFDLTYRRFLDLQKAEAQAREAQIEASLERIRAKAMAMHRSEEIDEVLEVLFDQFDVLGIVPMSTHLTLINLETNSFTFRETGKGGRKSFGEQTVPIDSMDIWKDAADRWRNMEPLSLNKLHFPKESLPMVWQVFHESFASMPEGHKITPEDYPDGIYHTAGNCKFGYIGMNQVRPATEVEEQIVLKFAVEFGRLYQRYLDLQKAEAQTKEARIEAALERVRSRTMGMQKSEELKEVIQVVYEQFVHLNIHIEHTGFIMDYKTRDDMHIWLADRNEVPSEVTIPYFDCAHWNSFNESKKKGKSFFANHLSFEEKNKFYQDLFKLIPGMPEETKEYYFSCPGLAISTVLLDNVGLYIENFSGIPYSDEENATLMRFGKVFQQTYTRFNDLKLAEAHAVQAEEDLVKLQTEKKRAEDALSELQVTQKQLIQSEKMASLGELTAGIAHEIQNPLNFVNNFSDVNKELLVEMKEEIEKGNTEEVIAIANNIISNEEKINHHGKRADAIVKGMLQHSRSSSGVKEPTDINELADEYLRLAYHGLRAKDKSFNATMKTDFDEKVGKVSIVPQDIGRAVLNLITNAFYAAPLPPEGGGKEPKYQHEPTIWVSTKKVGDKILISVKDNGPGIPQKVLDKIFHPFFTTKPTGQGTGLGLSLSYDIVKAHGGEIKVKTKEGEGSEFVIQLPIDQ